MSGIRASLELAVFQRALLEVMLVGVLGGVVGVHVLLRRMPFFVVALSHATFPGVVLAALVGVSLFVGGAVAGLVVVLAVALAGSSRLDDTSATGVVLAGAFAVGLLVQSGSDGGSRELTAFLVGSPLTVTGADVAVTAVLGIAVLAALGMLHKELVFGAFDPAGADALGYRSRALDTVARLLVVVTLVVVIPAVGTLLAIAVLTVPALTARLWCDRIGPMMAMGAAIGAACAVAGMLLQAAYGLAPGAAIALVSSGVFAVSLVARSVAARP